ncbi:helix-turn-helix domain-containing protein [Xanthomonas oryzae]|uniref:helix-turn-helix domain-containing protein n=1 Tax=Xanthomonas oryzae TaxID=347 RepID=UPI0009AF0132|nr:helix-turn-helix transcriptional regulator [Xanthomonas oryzae]QBG84720.1 XRE family transcriptional regulator [Xanthomonas oryzae]
MRDEQSYGVLLAFGDKLRRLRLHAGLSQEELAARAQLDRTYVSSCERGRRNVSLLALVRLASALSCSEALLVDGLSKVGGQCDER